MSGALSNTSLYDPSLPPMFRCRTHHQAVAQAERCREADFAPYSRYGVPELRKRLMSLAVRVHENPTRLHRGGMFVVTVGTALAR